MDSSQGSSFIPKAPVRGAVTKRRVRKVYVFTYLIYIVFICSLLAAGGFWFIKYSADQKLADAQRTLTEERSKFSDSDVATVLQLNERMKEADQLLASHVSVVEALEAVEAVTVASVTMTGLTYSKADSASLKFSLLARTDNFNSARFQREVLSANPVLAGAALTNISYGVSDLAAEGEASYEEVVSFNIEKALEPRSIEPPLPAGIPDASFEATIAPAVEALDVATPASDSSGDEETP